jgi:hypothetical protein
VNTAPWGDLPRIDLIRGASMLHRKLSQFHLEQRPVWIFLRDQQCWIEQARIVEIEGDLITLRYHEEDEDELLSWEESVRLDSIGAVRSRLAGVSRSADADDLLITGDCPEAERLSSS